MQVPAWNNLWIDQNLYLQMLHDERYRGNGNVQGRNLANVMYRRIGSNKGQWTQHPHPTMGS